MKTFLFVAVAILAIAYRKLRHVGSRPKGLPPGPPTLPLLGNLHLMPKSQPHVQFKKWADEYGPIYSLMLGSSIMIVLSSDVVVKDLLDKRSNIYSSRPSLYIASKIGSGLRMLLMPYGKKWRSVRSTIHDHINIRASKSYFPYQDLENRYMLLGLLEKPEKWNDHLRRYTNSLTTQIVFGFRSKDIDDRKMVQLYDGFAEFSECFMHPESRALDCFPFLQRVPEALMPIKKRASRLSKSEMELYLGHWMTAKKSILAGTSNPCMCADLLNSQNKENFSDAQVAYISGTLLEAGSDTTWSTLVGWVQAMVLFPEVMKKGQEAIDLVCGDRMPTLEDEPNLQLIRGHVKESLRWMPTAILGMPHAVIQDDSYGGYRIPKGATLIMNVWGIHNDENRYSNPRRFDPTRYSSDFRTASEAATTPDPSKRDHFSFGAGRRICQGMHIAERSLFLAIARLLWAFDFALLDGATTDPQDLTEGTLVHPRDVPAKLTVRSQKREEAVRREWEAVEDKLDENAQWKKVPEGMFYKEYVPLKT